MADVYKFKVKLKELPKVIWRDIEITSVSTVAKLGYAILAAFECQATHLFSIRFHKVCYDIFYEDSSTKTMQTLDERFKELFRSLGEEVSENFSLKDEFNLETTADAIKTKLSDLNLAKGDVLHMEYDFGAGWEFSIKLTRITEMKKGTGSHYPYVTNGQGRGIIEDIFPFELAEMIKKTNETGNLPKIYDGEIEWDYRDFDLEYCNTFFKDIVYKIQSVYEN